MTIGYLWILLIFMAYSLFTTILLAVDVHKEIKRKKRARMIRARRASRGIS